MVKTNKEEKLAEYIYKTFSNHTRNKEKENYIVNRIWNKLDNLNIKPVTQQSVKPKDGKIFFIDLYFPQVNYGIEIDEEFHANQKSEDATRETFIISELANQQKLLFSSLFAVENLYEVKHISTINEDHSPKSINLIHKEIDEIVSDIKEKFREKEYIWWKESKTIIREKHCFKLKDKLCFSTIKDVRNSFLSKDLYKDQRKGSCFCDIMLDNNITAEGVKLWFPQLGKNRWGNKLKFENNDWTIYEKDLEKDKENNEFGKKRVTFALCEDYMGEYYRFIGVYKYKETILIKNKENNTMESFNLYTKDEDNYCFINSKKINNKKFKKGFTQKVAKLYAVN